MRTPKLEKWSLIGETVVGEVYGHPVCKDGEIVRTSQIVALDLERKRVLTRNTLYTLGEADTCSLAPCGTRCLRDER